jgi:hypothetical protein
MKNSLRPLLLFLSMSFGLLLSSCEKKEVTSEKKPALRQDAASVPRKPTEQVDKREQQKATLARIASTSKPVRVDFTSIAVRAKGKPRKLGDLYSELTGVEGVVPNWKDVNFTERLQLMWTRKLDRDNVSGATIDHAHTPLTRYVENPDKKSLKEFAAEAEQSVALIKKNLDKDGVCKEYKLTPQECAVWKAFLDQVRGIDLLAYGLTELMPSSEGELNVALLDILLRNAGATYLFTIPALHDRLLSLGLYQFTYYAVNGHSGQGASRVNKHLPPHLRIPGSVVHLSGSDHHKAAYLFALDNFANLAKNISNREFTALKAALRKKPGDIVTYMAAAHHAPGLAMKSMKGWLANGAKKDLNAHLEGRLVPYGKKSDNNLAALEKVLIR